MRNIKILNIVVIFMIVLNILVSFRCDVAYSYDSLLRPEARFGKNKKVEMFERFKEAFRRQYGGKAFGTMELLQEYAKRLGFKVPEFENIGTDIFRGFLEHNSITREKINEIYKERRSEYVESDIYKNFIKGLFTTGEFTEEQERELRKVFDAMRAHGFPVIAIRSSSVLEDSQDYQFKGIYESEFFSFSQDAEKDFVLFKEKVKKVYATIFSSKAKAYLKEKSIPDIDEMGILVQKVVGKSHGHKFYPPLSGVTLFEPYSPNATVTYLNLGLNTRTVRGKYIWKWVSVTDPAGQKHISGSAPTKGSMMGRENNEYDIIISFGQTIIQSYTDESGSNRSLFRSYSEEKEDFLYKLHGDPSNMEFTRDIALKIDEITKGLRKGKGKPVEIEWSVDDDGNINIYQCRFSYDFEEFYSEPVELPSIPSERIIAESNLVSGHKEVSAPLILATVDSDEYDFDTFIGIIMAMHEVGEFILAIDFNELVDVVGIDATASFIPDNLPHMIGILNISDEPVPLGAHWSERLIGLNIPIISTTHINIGLLSRLCTHIMGSLRYSTVPVKMAVDGIKQEGRLWVSEEELNSSLPASLNEVFMHNGPLTDL